MPKNFSHSAVIYEALLTLSAEQVTNAMYSWFGTAEFDEDFYRFMQLEGFITEADDEN